MNGPGAASECRSDRQLSLSRPKTGQRFQIVRQSLQFVHNDQCYSAGSNLTC
jgi:hypothetical protein